MAFCFFARVHHRLNLNNSSLIKDALNMSVKFVKRSALQNVKVAQELSYLFML